MTIKTLIAEHIVFDPGIRFGKATIKGTRIAVVDILGWLASGMTTEDIVADFPELTREHIQTALAFAAYRDDISEITAA